MKIRIHFYKNMNLLSNKNDYINVLYIFIFRNLYYIRHHLLYMILYNICDLLDILGCIIMSTITYSCLIFLISQLSSAMSLAFSLSLCFNFASLASFSSIACLNLAFSALILTFSALILVFLTRSSMIYYFNESSSDCIFDNIFYIECDLLKCILFK